MSWIIVDRSTGKPVYETWDKDTMEKFDPERFERLTAMEWLQRFNKSVRENARLPRSS